MAGTPQIIGPFSHPFEHGGVRVMLRCFRNLDGRITVDRVDPVDHCVPQDAIEAEREELENLGRGLVGMRSLV